MTPNDAELRAYTTSMGVRADAMSFAIARCTF
jgi:hypothetical protein